MVLEKYGDRPARGERKPIQQLISGWEKPGGAVTIVSGRYKGYTGVVNSVVAQRTVDYTKEYGLGCRVRLPGA